MISLLQLLEPGLLEKVFKQLNLKLLDIMLKLDKQNLTLGIKKKWQMEAEQHKSKVPQHTTLLMPSLSTLTLVEYLPYHQVWRVLSEQVGIPTEMESACGIQQLILEDSAMSLIVQIANLLLIQPQLVIQPWKSTLSLMVRCMRLRMVLISEVTRSMIKSTLRVLYWLVELTT